MIHENETEPQYSSLPGMTPPADPHHEVSADARTRTWVPRPGSTQPARANWKTHASRARFRVSVWVAELRLRFNRLTRRLNLQSLRRYVPRSVADFVSRYRRQLGMISIGVVILLAFAALGGSGEDGKAIANARAVESQRAVASGGAADSMCGSDDASPPPRISEGDWQDYSCQTRREADRWSSCLRRGQYVRGRGKGCPGRQRCCPTP